MATKSNAITRSLILQLDSGFSRSLEASFKKNELQGIGAILRRYAARFPSVGDCRVSVGSRVIVERKGANTFLWANLLAFLGVSKTDQAKWSFAIGCLSMPPTPPCPACSGSGMDPNSFRDEDRLGDPLAQMEEELREEIAASLRNLHAIGEGIAAIRNATEHCISSQARTYEISFRSERRNPRLGPGADPPWQVRLLSRACVPMSSGAATEPVRILHGSEPIMRPALRCGVCQGVGQNDAR